MKQSHSAGGVVLNRKGQVLVVNQRGRSWSLPKGHIEEGEVPLAAARREIYEESGLDQLELVRELGTYRRPKIGLNGGSDPVEMKTITIFLFRTDQETLQPQDADNPEARWVEQEKVADLLTHEMDKIFFRGILPDL